MPRVFYLANVTDQYGVGITGATVTILPRYFATPIAAYTNSTGTTRLATPLLTVAGKLGVWLDDAVGYNITVTGTGIQQYTDFFDAISAETMQAYKNIVNSSQLFSGYATPRGPATPIGRIFDGYATPQGRQFDGYATPTITYATPIGRIFGGYATPLATAAIMSLGVLGDGSDGVVALDGTATFAGFTSKSGSVYTLTRDVNATNLSVANGVTLNAGGFKVFATGTVTINNGGIITNNGIPGLAAGTPAAATTVSGTTRQSGAPGTGGTTGGFAGAAGLGANIGSGNAGAGGTSGANTGGAGGTVNGTDVYQLRQLQRAITSFFIPASGTTFILSGAPGGGGGGGDGTNRGGGGGSGGGVVIIFANTIVNNGLCSANGGAGGTPTVGNCGGGGGGGGGVVALYTPSYSGTGTVTATGGAAGLGVGTGGAGTAGGNGTTLTLIIP